jgi:hypothetical protein
MSRLWFWGGSGIGIGFWFWIGFWVWIGVGDRRGDWSGFWIRVGEREWFRVGLGTAESRALGPRSTNGRRSGTTTLP